ncbi:LytTR family transcriptional regulator [Actinoplanes philippinensis]|uniref:Cell envelope-related function transcriptional attenuator common domain-containing protein n=1 Tax=Actinoplanes philippinensis TaxID=35752 RepID=A0A1I2GVB9_9ACTN|nr:LCP family protein [Actinoplanes philippinensis]GIE78115.1 LytTR family transcriptional regulator [Actinoplanes philippinensis]SFF21158.1 cell envelope-related function transcriptional attenuator common domain-containing protein [Actinoplanes philippinensis]
MSTSSPDGEETAVTTTAEPEAGEQPAAEPAPKKKRPLWARLLIWTGVVVVVLSIGAVVGARLLVSRYTGAVAQEPMLGDAAVPEPAKGVSPLAGPLNILLVGVDDRADDENGVGTRADSIIVVHINAAHDKAYMLSVPRDTLVQIPAYPKTGFTGSHEKINAAFQHGSGGGGGRAGGFELLAKTVSQVTGMKFNAGMIANFVGFEGAVNALGGVDMCIDQKVTSIHMNTEGKVRALEGGDAKVYEPGCRHLEPWEALDYVRQRHTKGGDYDRQRHQQQFVKAVMKEALDTGVSSPLTLDRVLTATGKALTADWGKASMTDWLLTARGIGSDGVTMLRTNGGDYASVKCPNGASCENLTAESRKMFDAAREDKLDAFIAAHPTWAAAGK